MPKMCERGDAQKLLSKTGNSHERKGYAQLKGRTMPKKQKANNKKTKFYEGSTKTIRKKEGKTLTPNPFSVLTKIKIHTELNKAKESENHNKQFYVSKAFQQKNKKY